MDEVLYNAGVCYEDAKSIGKAIQMYEVLNQRFPKSLQAQKALGRSGNAYGAIAFYDRSAAKYEQFAKKYGGEKDAPSALQNAVTYRKGIGDDKAAIADIEFFVKQYKNKMKKEAADALWGLVGIYEKQGNQEAVDQGARALPQGDGDQGRPRSRGRRARPHRPDPVGAVVQEQGRGRRLHQGRARARHPQPRQAPARRRAAGPLR